MDWTQQPRVRHKRSQLNQRCYDNNHFCKTSLRHCSHATNGTKSDNHTHASVISTVQNVQTLRFKCASVSPPVSVSFPATANVMTSNTNPLDWDYGSSRAASGRPEALGRTSLGCLPVVLAMCLWFTTQSDQNLFSNVIPSFRQRHSCDTKLFRVDIFLHSSFCFYFIADVSGFLSLHLCTRDFC